MGFPLRLLRPRGTINAISAEIIRRVLLNVYLITSGKKKQQQPNLLIWLADIQYWSDLKQVCMWDFLEKLRLLLSACFLTACCALRRIFSFSFSMTRANFLLLGKWRFCTEDKSCTTFQQYIGIILQVQQTLNQLDAVSMVCGPVQPGSMTNGMRGPTDPRLGRGRRGKRGNR